MQKQIIEIIEKEYEIGTVLDVHEILSGTTNRSFGILVNDNGCRRKYIVRKYIQGTTVEEIRFEAALINHATENGLRISAKTVVTRAGEVFFQPPNSKDIFAVCEYLEGDDKYNWNSTNLTDIEYISAGAVLADFHNAARNFDPTGQTCKEPPIEKLVPLFHAKLKEFAAHQRGSKLIPYLSKNLNRIKQIIKKNTSTPTRFRNMPVIPIHCDFHPGNLKWHGEKVVGLFDFDWAKMDLRLFDVCMSLIYFCSIWEGEHAGKLHLDKCKLFLRSYQNKLRELKGLEPLNPKELKAFPKLLAMANIYLLFWVVATYIENENASDAEYLSYLRHCVQLMQWTESHASVIGETIANAVK